MQSNSSTTYGHGEGLQIATKEAPTWAGESGVQVGREKPWLLPFKALSNTTFKLEE